MYKINPLALSEGFVLPTALTDEFLRLAGGSQLKCILWLYRHMGEPCDIMRMSSELNISPGDIEDYMSFWIEKGLAFESEIVIPDRTIPEKTEIKPVETQPVEKKTPATVPDLPDIKPTPADIAMMLSNNPELKQFFVEIQKLYGPMGYDKQATFVMIHSTYGLPCDVILMAAQYEISRGNRDITSIKKTAKKWATEKIDTIEKAGERILAEETIDENWRIFRRETRIDIPNPTEKLRQYFNHWLDDMKYPIEIIIRAYEITLDSCNKINWKYTNSILERWYKSNIRTIQDIEKDDETRKKEKEQPSADRSYDLSVAEKRMNEIPVFTKRDE